MNSEKPCISAEREAQIAAAHDELAEKHPLIAGAIPEMTGGFAADSIEEVDEATRQLSRGLRGDSQSALQNARLLGQALWAIKLRSPDEHWTIWLENNSPYSVRRSQEFMKLARHWAEVEKAAAVNPDFDLNSLSIDRALKIMRSKPSDPNRPKKRRDEDGEVRNVVMESPAPIPGEFQEEPVAGSKEAKLEYDQARRDVLDWYGCTGQDQKKILKAKHKCLGQALFHLKMAELYFPPGGNDTNRQGISIVEERVARERALIQRAMKDLEMVQARRVPDALLPELELVAEAEHEEILAGLERMKAHLMAMHGAAYSDPNEVKEPVTD